MRAAGTVFLASAVTGAVLTPLVRTAALRLGALDHSLTSRKVHGRPIPRVGGLAIVAAFYAPLVALFFANSDVGRRLFSEPTRAAALFAGGLAIAGLGVFDDLRGVRPRNKLIVQFAVATFMYLCGFRINHIANPFDGPIDLDWLGLPFTVLWITGVINAMNLIDGLDGLAGGVALIAIATTFAIAGVRPQPLMQLLSAALAGAVLGFLFYNFNPATIFMGDTGSMFLGFVLATTAIQTNQKSSTTVAILVPIIVLGLPIADTLLAMARRAARGVPMFSADRGHIHHRLLDAGLSHRKTVLVLYAASLLLAGVALVLSFASSRDASIVLVVLSGCAFVALRRLGFLNLSKVQRVLEDRRRNLVIRRAIRHVGDSLRVAPDTTAVWQAVQKGATTLGASAVALHLPAELDYRPCVLSSGFDEPGLACFRARYGLLPERPGETQIEFGWADGRSSLDRDSEIAIELLCDHLSSALERLARNAPDSVGPSKQAV